MYGITELTCWLARILANVIEIVLVQSLYTSWKEEEIVSKRLRDLSLQAVTIPAETAAYHQNGGPFYQNNAFNTSMEQLQYLGSLKRASSTPHLFGNFAFPNNMMGNVFDYYQGYQGYQFTTASEFNASIFVPQKIDTSTESSKFIISIKLSIFLINLKIKFIFSEKNTILNGSPSSLRITCTSNHTG